MASRYTNMYVTNFKLNFKSFQVVNDLYVYELSKNKGTVHTMKTNNFWQGLALLKYAYNFMIILVQNCLQ